MLWLAFSLAVIVAIACLWWFAMRQRNRQPPKPTRPYRQWKD
jgi:cytoskeletal protein RodZ